jgi:hypothetical protein
MCYGVADVLGLTKERIRQRWYLICCHQVESSNNTLPGARLLDERFLNSDTVIQEHMMHMRVAGLEVRVRTYSIKKGLWLEGLRLGIWFVQEGRKSELVS